VSQELAGSLKLPLERKHPAGCATDAYDYQVEDLGCDAGLQEGREPTA
jgi:hypothetical protein